MKTRALTGLALAAAVAALAWWSPAWLFAALGMAVAVAALVEWNRLGPGGGAGKLAVASAAAVMLGAGVTVFASPQQLAVVCVAGALLWAWLAWEALRHRDAPTVTVTVAADARHSKFGNLAQGAALLWVAWCALVYLRMEHGAGAAVGAVAAVAAADTGAYFAGKFFGKRKLAPAISPGKTVAGVVGGIGVTVIGAGALAWVFAPDALRWWLAAATVAAAFSVAGDLHESALKRRAGVKDSGGILPGHGGILDRIDGLIAALPPFAVVWQLAEAAE